MSEDTPSETGTEEASADEAEASAARERQYADPKRGRRKVLEGIVISTRMAKTAIVSIERMESHPKYKKYIRRHSKIYVHDEEGVAKVGDQVRVIECRRMSKLKRFRLQAVVPKH
jgi:small subunit ribosomal protein S17